MHKTVNRRSEAGAALMTALGILAILSMLGGAFVVFMRIGQSSAEYDLDVLRARYLARGGIEVARARVLTLQDIAGSLEDPSGIIEGELAEGKYMVHIEEVNGAYECDAMGILTRRDGSVVTAGILARFRRTESALGVEMWQE